MCNTSLRKYLDVGSLDKEIRNSRFVLESGIYLCLSGSTRDVAGEIVLDQK